MKTIAESDLYLKNAFLILVLASTFFVASCKETDEIQEEDTVTPFAMGVDLSYVNQILDFSGSFKENSVVKDPYSILRIGVPRLLVSDYFTIQHGQRKCTAHKASSFIMI